MNELEASYRATSYDAYVGDEVLTLRIGESNPRLDTLLDTTRTTTWAYVTASNPGSRPHPPAWNAVRNRCLREELETAGYVVFSGHGRADDGMWEAEESLLVLGIAARDAVEIGRCHGQMAVVLGARSQAARLEWC